MSRSIKQRTVYLVQVTKSSFNSGLSPWWR